MQDAFADRLRNARIMKGFSMDELVNEMNHAVTKTAIMKYEKGIMKPNSSILISLSKALDQPLDYFFRPFSFHVESIRFRKRSHLSAKTENAIREKVCDMIERYVCIEEICNDFIQFIPPEYKDISCEEQVRAVALDLRKKWDLGNDGIINVIELLENHGIKVIEIEASSDFDGLSSMVNDYIPVIVLNTGKCPERKRFTALHELGHLLLSFAPGISSKTEESLCHCFASEMLLPESVFRKEIGDKRNNISYPELKSLQSGYGISCEALMHKACRYGIISVQRYRSFCIQKNSNQILKRAIEKTLFPPEESHRFSSLVYRALCNDLITVSKAASLLNKTANEVREQAAII